MNLRLSILLVMVLLIFGGAFLVVKFTESDETPDNRPWLYRIDENAIVHISVSYRGDTVSYRRKAGSPNWYILGEPDIPVFHRKWAGTPLLLSGPKVTRVLADTMTNPAAFGLAPPVTRVTVTDRSGRTIEFHLGDPTPATHQQYARLVGNPTLFTVPVSFADEIKRLATSPPYLQLYQLVDETLEYIEVRSNNQTNIYLKHRDTGQWYIQGETLVPVFSEKWDDTPAFISGPRVDQVVTESFHNPGIYGLDAPQANVRLSVLTGEVTEFQIGSLTDDGKYRHTWMAGEPRLFAMPDQWAQRITDLATQPPYPPRASEESE